MRVLLALGPRMEPLSQYVRDLPCEVVFTAHQREAVAEYLQDLGTDELPAVMLAAESLPGNPPGISFVTAVRRYWPEVRVVWFARAISEEVRQELSAAQVDVILGQVTGKQIASLLGVAAPQQADDVSEQDAPDQAVAVQLSLPPEMPPVRPAEEDGEREEASEAPYNSGVVEVQQAPLAAEVPSRPHVIAVWSPKSEGATTTALHLSKILAQSQPTILLDLNLKKPQLASFFREGEHNVDFSPHSLELIWPNLDVGELTSDLLQTIAWKAKGKHSPAVLAGIRRREFFSNYSLNPLVQLMQVAKAAYGHVVIDVSADMDNAALEAALTYSDVVLIVMKPTWFSLEAYTESRRIQDDLQMDHEHHRILLIKDTRSPYTAEDVTAFCAVPVIGSVPWVPEMDHTLSLGEYLSGSSKLSSEYLRGLQDLKF